MEENILEVKNLSVGFDGQDIISGLNFSVRKGETLAVIGPNGAGKTVLLRTLLGILPYSGEIIWQKGVKIGYVPQKLIIEKGFPLSVAEFLRIRGIETEIEEAIKKTGIKDKTILEKRLCDLSGGEFQRIMIARALIGNPDILLFDEPLTGIDLGGEETIYNLLHKLGESRNVTIILISHDLSVVYKHANNVLCLNKKRFCYGNPAEVINKTAELYGEMTTLYGQGHTHATAGQAHEHNDN